MDGSVRIAGDLTIEHWLSLREELDRNFENTALWEKAFQFFDKRLTTRYIRPIEAIESDSGVQGEGFAICAILCSLIEALETFYQGRVYRKGTKDNPLDETKEYYQSQPIFESFLIHRDPFKQHFTSNEMASEFYENFRCALLHEAATRNGWVIRVDTGRLIEKDGNKKVFNRRLFIELVKRYMESYRQELFKDKERKKAFIRKMDSICNTA